MVTRAVVVRRAAVGTASVTAGAGLLAGAGSIGAATYFARRVLTPDQRRPDDVTVLAVDQETGWIELAASPDTVSPGRYGLWLDGGVGHLRLGEVLQGPAAVVRRRLLGVDSGTAHTGPARWNQYFYAGDPRNSLGLQTHQVWLDTDVGEMPAWDVPAHTGAEPDTGRWAVLVHGRGARRDECLRAVPPLRSMGYRCLIPMYRNDFGAPPSRDGRYSLGLSEWRDIEAAVLHAVTRGAKQVVLVGWSMGGAIVLQMLDRSWLSDRIDRVVLDAPVIDWVDVLRHHASLNRLPAPVGSLARRMVRTRRLRRLVGVHEPVDLAVADWVRRADELSHPMLLIHSRDDEFVPVGPSAALAAARPDLVRFEPWRVARHTQEWNVDPARWEGLLADFLGAG